MRSAGTKIAVAILLAGTMIALALYLRPAPDRYSYDVRETEVRRFDSATGALLVCSPGGGCWLWDWNTKKG